MDIDVEEQRRASGRWLRTGRLPTVRLADGTELKFNPYHDPRNGQFTFAPGGAAGDGGILVRYANVRPRNSVRPIRVVIIRPRQFGADHTYAIPRPETKR